MKKLTAGIFSVLVGLVSVNAADAAVASQGYVDAKTQANADAIGTLTTTVADNKTAAENALNTYSETTNAEIEGLKTSVGQKVAQSDYDTKVADLQTQIDDKQVALKVAEGSALKLDAQGNLSLEGLASDSDLANLQKTVTKLDGDATIDGSVAKQIVDALTTAQGYANTAESNAKTYTDNSIAALSTGEGAIAKLDVRVTTAEGEIDDLQAQLGDANITNYSTTEQMNAAISTAVSNATGENSALAGRVTTAEGEIDALQISLAEGGATANAIKAAADAAADADTKAQGAVDVNTTQQDEIDALETGKIPVPGVECQNMSNYCVLTYGTDPATQQPAYYWEVIMRGEGETAPYTANPANNG